MNPNSLNLSLSSISCLSEECSANILLFSKNNIQTQRTLTSLMEAQLIEKKIQNKSSSASSDELDRNISFSSKIDSIKFTNYDCFTENEFSPVLLNPITLNNDLIDKTQLETSEMSGALDYSGSSFFEFHLWKVRSKDCSCDTFFSNFNCF